MSATPTPGIPPEPETANRAFRALCNTIATLRSPTGCPWDREQTLKSIKPYTLEETYELLEAIDSNDDDAIIEELGDVLLQVLLYAQIGSDAGRFDLIPVLERLNDKLIRRHPHVFGTATAEKATDVSPLWEQAKRAEKQRDSIFEGIPQALPELARATRLSSRAAKAGYDFPQRAMLFDKLREELAELNTELFESDEPPHIPASIDAPITPDHHISDPAHKQRIESELGDVLFVVANIARRWGINPEEALRSSNRKFESRVRFIEQQLAQQGRQLPDATLAEQEAIYQQKKSLERNEAP